ncbi:MAG: FtsX-like permease family protein, partial [Terriglobus roseus]|nr:FtsX-like permease family protein [Terriglobus roseus]
MLLYGIACLNVAGLLLARSDARSREFAIRGALGATRSRLARQFALESLILVVLGAVFGSWGAAGGIRLLLQLIPADQRLSMPFLREVHLSPHTLWFILAESLLAVLAFTIVPALRVRLTRLRSSLASGTSGSGSLSWRRVGSQIVVAEVAVAVVLLVCAGLLSRSLLQLLRIDLRLQPEHLLTLSVGTPDSPFKTEQQKLQVHQAVAERLRQVPGVQDVAFGEQLPVTYNGNTDWIRLVGKPYDGHHNEVNERTASPRYFAVLGTPLLRGREFTADDTQGKQPVVIVNRKLADMYFPGEDPIGKQIGDTDLSPASLKTIVGVVDDVHEGALDDDVWPAEYLPAYQNEEGRAEYVVRVAGAEQTILPELAAAVRQVSRDLGISNETTMESRIHDSQSATVHRGAAWLANVFSGVALLLCAFGLYGVVMYSVSLRTREMGVRLALGSSRVAIYQLILRESTALSVGGLVLGLLLAIGTAVALRSVLFQVSAWDGTTLAVVSGVVLACSLLAGWLPARRAAML